MLRIVQRSLCICLGISLIVGVLLLVAFATTPPSISLSVVGLTTQVIPPSVSGLSTNIEFVCAVIRVTNSGIRSISYKADGSIPGYSRFRPNWGGWKESPYLFFCGLSVNDYTLSASESVTFEAIIEPDQPCRIGLPYSEQGVVRRKHRVLPIWLTERVRWLQDQPIAITPTIKWEIKR